MTPTTGSIATAGSIGVTAPTGTDAQGPNQTTGRRSAKGRSTNGNRADGNRANGNRANGNQASGNQASGNQASGNQAEGNRPATGLLTRMREGSPGGTKGLIAFIVFGVLTVVAVVVITVVMERKPETPSTPTPTATVAAPITVKSVQSSFDPRPGGSGFKQDGKGWHTQSYTTNKFGNYKPGVGLVLDLRSAREVTSVKFDAGAGPITVELRAGDALPTGPTGASDLSKIGAENSAAQGITTLKVPASAKQHRYWMLWVTKLGSGPEGYAAAISDITVKAVR
jgi:hypothetical protein